MQNLNCNPGDLAMIVKGRKEWQGKIVYCSHQTGRLDVLPIEHKNNIWKINIELPYFYSNLDRDVNLAFCPDEYLVPLKWSDDTDEMLLIAGKAGIENATT